MLPYRFTLAIQIVLKLRDEAREEPSDALLGLQAQFGSTALETIRSFVLSSLVSVDPEDPLRIFVLDSSDS